MKKHDYTTCITVNASALDAFNSINNVKGWWTENMEGSSEHVGDVFTVSFGQTYITLRVAESVPGKKIVWNVTDCNKHWLKNKKEWTGTQVAWEISADSGTAKIDFTHLGLVPELECFDACDNAWTGYLQGSLKNLVNKGKGQPEPKEIKVK
jgi:hypothetical protein